MCAALWTLSVFLLFPATLSVCSSLCLSGEPSPCMDQALWPHLAQRHACFRSHKQWCKSRQIFYRHVYILTPSFWLWFFELGATDASSQLFYSCIKIFNIYKCNKKKSLKSWKWQVGVLYLWCGETGEPFNCEIRAISARIVERNI